MKEDKIKKIKIKKYKPYFINDITDYQVNKDGEINNILYTISKTETVSYKLKLIINR